MALFPMSGVLRGFAPAAYSELSVRYFHPFTLEAISKIRIRFESKAQVGKKAEHTREYVSILSRPVTPLSGLRRVFEMASSLS
jgi:hypothetical protein